jgi:hypothetical protein
MTTKYFISACILTVGLLVKTGAPPLAIVMGIALAGFFHWRKARGAVSK